MSALIMNVDSLSQATGALKSNAQKYLNPLIESMERYSIDSKTEKAAYLATLTVESMNLSKVEESLYYRDAAYIMSLYPRAFKTLAQAKPYERNHAGMSKLLYQGYHGRGLIQITWKDNYRDAGEALGFDYLSNPDLLLQPWHAAMTAGWFWTTNNIGPAARRGDMDTVTLKVNGPRRLHLQERKQAFAKAKTVLA